MKKITLIFMLLGAFTFGTTGCGNDTTESKTEHKEGDGHNHAEGDGHNHEEHVGHDHSISDTTHHEADGHQH